MDGRALLFLSVLVLAGCSQTPASSGPESALEQADQAAEQVGVSATATTGIIRGVVVDPAVRPVPGVLVEVEGTGLNQTTNEQGAFGFDGLPAGTYFLAATRPRYEPMRVGVVVEAGKQQPEPVRIVMLALPGTEPFIESFSGSMFIAAGVSFIGGFGGEDLGIGQPNRLIFSMVPNATVVQMESRWSQTSPTSAHLRMYGSVTMEERPLEIRSMAGASPLWLRNNGTVDNDVADGFYFGVDALAWSPGSLTAPDPEGAVVVNQAVDGFAFAFHNFVPDEGWLFVRDGEHPLPPP